MSTCAWVMKKKDNHIYKDETAKAFNYVPFFTKYFLLNVTWNGFMNDLDEWLNSECDGVVCREENIIETENSVLMFTPHLTSFLHLYLTNLCSTMSHTSFWLT